MTKEKLEEVFHIEKELKIYKEIKKVSTNMN